MLVRSRCRGGAEVEQRWCAKSDKDVYDVAAESKDCWIHDK